MLQIKSTNRFFFVHLQIYTDENVWFLSNKPYTRNKLMDNKQAALEIGTKPIGKLLMQYALPAIIAMTASSLYNMVDSIFIGHGVGPLGISGLAITFPFMNLSAAFGAGIGVGSATLLSVKLGQKDYQAAQNILGNTLVLNIIISIVFTTLSLLFLNPILRFFGASDQTLPYAHDYMQIILLGNMVTYLYFSLNALLRAAGKPKNAMYATIFTVILNTLLDPLFIWTFDLGIKGAAYATVMAQVTALMWQLNIFSNKNELIHFRKGIYKLKKDLVTNIIAIGISPFSMNACAALVVIIINTSLVKYGGDMAVGAFGIVNRISFIFVMITMGVNQGMQPIAGYNYGAQNLDRLMKVLKYAILAATAIMTIGFIIGQFFTNYCVSIFTSDKTLIDTSVHAMKQVMIMFPIIGYQMVITNFFQSIGMAKISIFLSLSRQLLLLIPFLYILPSYWGLDGIWLSLPASDALSAVIAAGIMVFYMKKFKKQHKELTDGK